MKCIHINIRSSSFLVLAVLLNGIKHTHMDNNIPHNSVESTINNVQETKVEIGPTTEILECPSGIHCNKLNYPCINCTLPKKCRYGEELEVSCQPRPEVKCMGTVESFQRKMICRYCYQTEPWEHKCILQSNCISIATPRQYYRTNCTVASDIICLGNRMFPKRVLCNWTGGYRWSTALILSITLGGFGADRFYLGHWQEGIGKLFSFGGLGVWTLIDVILISLHYLGPADGSLYL